MYPGSSFYGIKKILLKHAKLPEFLPFPFAVQHGWQRIAHNYEAGSRPPEIWVWSARIADDLARFYPRKKIRVAGSFFCYHIQSVKEDIRCGPNKMGSICIPPHSSHHAKTLYSAENFAKYLSRLPDEYKPIRVMLYYLDMTQEVMETYQKYGFDIVTNGELTDDAFIDRFVKNINGKKYCIFSDLGSGVLFSLNLGLLPYQVSIASSIDNHGNPYLSESYISDSKKFDEDFLTKLDEKSCNEELGEKYLMSSRHMRRVILRGYLKKEFLITVIRRLGGKVLRKCGLWKNV